MDINTFRIATTLISLAIFLVIVYWAMSPRSRAGFEEAARLPLEDDALDEQRKGA
jgi:cytochrome c oxidase cbb3-type subunit 4